MATQHINENTIIGDTGISLKELINKLNKKLESSDLNSINNRIDICTKRIFEQEAIPVGEYTLWQGDRTITGNNTFQELGWAYNAKWYAIQKYPPKTGYKRTAKLVLEYTDNLTGDYSVYVRLDQQNGYSKEYLYPITWGGTGNDIRRWASLDMDYDGITNDHITIYVTPSFAAGSKMVSFHRLYMVLYDTYTG